MTDEDIGIRKKSATCTIGSLYDVISAHYTTLILASSRVCFLWLSVAKLNTINTSWKAYYMKNRKRFRKKLWAREPYNKVCIN